MVGKISGYQISSKQEQGQKKSVKLKYWCGCAELDLQKPEKDDELLKIRMYFAACLNHFWIEQDV